MKNFDKKWIEKHQKLLLWFLNANIIKYWFHLILGITGEFNYSYCIGFPDEKITEIGLRHFKIGGVWKKLKKAFFSKKRMSFRVFLAFYPIFFVLYCLEVMASLPFYILQFISGKARYKPIITWSDRSWVHNIFRVYELIFGRRFGIRAEISSYFDGQRAFYYAHSFEGACALLETSIRDLFRFKLPVRVWIPQLATPGLPKVSLPFMFAIAHDADSKIGAASTTSPATWNHTCTGSNGLLVAMFEVKTTTNTFISGLYNSIAMTHLAGASIVDATNAIAFDYWYKIGPSTGSNAISISFTTGASRRLIGVATSLTGVSAQDASNTASGTVSGSTPQPSVSVTTVADNCWVIGGTGVNDNGALSAGGSQTLFNQFNDGTTPFHTIAGSYRGPVTPAGSAAISYTGASNTDSWVAGASSFSPAGGGAPAPNVSDTTAITESVQMQIVSFVNKSDTTAVTDTPSEVIAWVRSVSDTTPISEVVQLQIVSVFNVSDTTAITDTPTIEEILFISVQDTTVVQDQAGSFSDTVYVFDNAIISIVSFINVNDTSAVTDSPQVMEVDLISVQDTTVITDIPIFNESFDTINVQDSTTVTDSPAIEQVYLISVQDTTNVTAVPTIEEFEQGDVVSDTTVISDAATMQIVSFINVSDSTVLTDNSIIEMFSFIITSDSTVISEFVVIEEFEQGDSVSDTTVISENVKIEVIYFINVNDQSAISDPVAIEEIEQGDTVFDTTVVTDSPVIELVNFINVFDLTVASDNSLVQIPGDESVHDTTVMSDLIQIQLVSIISVGDVTVVSDIPLLSLPVNGGEFGLMLGWQQANYVLVGDMIQLTLQL